MKTIAAGDIIKSKSVGGFIKVMCISKIAGTNDLVVCYKSVSENHKKHNIVMPLYDFLNFCNKLCYMRVKNVYKTG